MLQVVERVLAVANNRHAVLKMSTGQLTGQQVTIISVVLDHKDLRTAGSVHWGC